MVFGDMAEDLIAFVEGMDRCWMEQRFEDLSAYIAPDVIMVSPGGKQRMEGINAAVESYREFMARCKVHRFRTYDHVVTERGAAAVVEYDWEMSWHDQGADHDTKGREVLTLSRRESGWRVVWRTQLAD